MILSKIACKVIRSQNMFLMIIIIRVLQMVMQEIMVEYFIIDDH